MKIEVTVTVRLMDGDAASTVSDTCLTESPNPRFVAYQTMRAAAESVSHVMARLGGDPTDEPANGAAWIRRVRL